MEFRDFLISKIKEISRRFRHLTIKVEQNSLSEFYFVEITPVDEFRERLDLANLVNEIYIEQLETYPDESLTFLSEDSYYKITNPFLVVEGKEFYEVNYNLPASIIVNAKNLFNNYAPKIESQILMTIAAEEEAYYGFRRSELPLKNIRTGKNQCTFHPMSRNVWLVMVDPRIYKNEDYSNTEKLTYAF